MFCKNEPGVLGGDEEKKDSVTTTSGDNETGLQGEGDTPGSRSPQETLERWNDTRINVFRYLATLFSFIILGMSDAAYGVSIPPLYSHLSDRCPGTNTIRESINNASG